MSGAADRSELEKFRLKYSKTIAEGDLSVGLWAAVDVVDWYGKGSKDLILSYHGGVFLSESRGTSPDGTPVLLPKRKIEGISGYVTTVDFDGSGVFHIISAKRKKGHFLFFRNTGSPGRPEFSGPETVGTGVDENHMKVMFFDIDGDGIKELIVGTDFWDDYWPDGERWASPRYVPYDENGRWRGGPLRGHVYVLKPKRDVSKLEFFDPIPLKSDGNILEVYGWATSAFGDFRGIGRNELICADFLDRLHFFPKEGENFWEFGVGRPVKCPDGGDLVMPQCMHFCTTDDWDGDGAVDLLVGAEDGYIYFVRNTGRTMNGVPLFEDPVRVQTLSPDLHAGILSVPTVSDWNGDGKPDLIVGNGAGYILYYENLGDRDNPIFAKEIELEADRAVMRVQAGYNGSIQGPSEAKWGYTCPTVDDWDGDGLPDILMSDIWGYHTFFRNTGTRTSPRLAPGERLNFEGTELKTVWRVRPAVVDWLGNGRLSYVCLDEEARLSTYWKASDTELMGKRLLRFEWGDPVTFTEDFGGGRGRIKLRVYDWTGDGRYDIMAGTHSSASIPPQGIPRRDFHRATVVLLRNVGSNADPKFAAPVYVKFKGGPLKFGGHSCAPDIVEFDGDGEPDIVIGTEDGDIFWLPGKMLSC